MNLHINNRKTLKPSRPIKGAHYIRISAAIKLTSGKNGYRIINSARSKYPAKCNSFNANKRERNFAKELALGTKEKV